MVKALQKASGRCYATVSSLPPKIGRWGEGALMRVVVNVVISQDPGMRQDEGRDMVSWRFVYWRNPKFLFMGSIWTFVRIQLWTWTNKTRVHVRTLL